MLKSATAARAFLALPRFRLRFSAFAGWIDCSPGLNLIISKSGHGEVLRSIAASAFEHEDAQAWPMERLRLWALTRLFDLSLDDLCGSLRSALDFARIDRLTFDGPDPVIARGKNREWGVSPDLERFLSLAILVMHLPPEHPLIVEGAGDGLHPDGIDILVGMIRERGRQAFFSTQSPAMIDAVGLEDMRRALHPVRQLEDGLIDATPFTEEEADRAMQRHAIDECSPSEALRLEGSGSV